MKVCLVSSPTVTDFEDRTIAESSAIRLIGENAPLGILSLAAVLDKASIEVEIVDLNQWYYRFVMDENTSADFAQYVTSGLTKLEFDVLGFGTISSSYPLTLRIATALKRALPRAVIVLGGPQASVTDTATLQAFDAVSYVVRGEAEHSFPELLAALAGTGRVEKVSGVSYRRGRLAMKNAAAPVIEDLDALPLPAYHLFPSVEQCQYLPLELGRGCPFACKFCSTNDFFRRNFRLKSPQTMLAQMRELHGRYGVSNFELVHDMFTVDRRRVVDFCDAMLSSEVPLIWSCSARTDCVDEELIAYMHKAGCRGIFFGIETGSARMQRIVNKKIDLDEARRMVEVTDRQGIRTAVSLITGFPQETDEDLRDTVDFYIDALRFDHADPQLHLLAPLVETPLYSEYFDRLLLDDIMSDMSYQGWRQKPQDRELIAQHKSIFGNFYSVPTELDRDALSELREFMLNGSIRARWVLVALHQTCGDLTEVFAAWRRWRASSGRQVETDVASRGEYYAGTAFVDDLLRFANETYVEGRRGSAALSAMVRYSQAVLALDAPGSGADGTPDAPAARAPDRQVERIAIGDVPQVASGVRLVDLEADYERVLTRLRQKLPIRTVRRKPVTLALRPLARSEQTQVLQMSSLSRRLLQLCDGRRSVSDIIERMQPHAEEFSGIPVDRGCLFGLELLRRQDLITVADLAPALRAA